MKKTNNNVKKGIAKVRKIKNRDKLKKEDLKSESNSAERNYNTNIGNNTSVDINNTNDDDDTYDSKIREKISDIRMILSRLGNTVTKKDKKKIKKELYEMEKKQNLSDKEKKNTYDHLVKLVRTLDKKEKYKYHNR